MDSLKFIMRLNAMSCISFGLLFIVAPYGVAAFLGEVPQIVMSVLGVGLLGNGAHLVASSCRIKIRKIEVIWFSLGDFGWWLATLALVVSNCWITTFWGVVMAVLVATVVAVLGVAQLWAFGLHRHGNTGIEHLKEVTKSWVAFPLWVKVWLVFLNVVFLAAFAFLPDRVVEVTLVAYFATAPLLAGQVGYDAGFRHILALAHLAVWTPLLVWLMLLPVKTNYSLLLTIVVAICLIFDVNNLWLFIKGDRAVQGAPPRKVG